MRRFLKRRYLREQTMTEKSPPITLQLRGLTLNRLEVRRIERQLRRLERRLDNPLADPSVDLRLIQHVNRPDIEAQLRVQEEHSGPRYAADASSSTADKSVRLAVSRIERQLSRRNDRLRGASSYGVPSRRFPERRRLSRALRARTLSGTEADAIPDDRSATEQP